MVLLLSLPFSLSPKLKLMFVYTDQICCHCCSVAKLCLTLCGPVDCSTLGSSVLHYLPEFAQIHVHWVGDAIQPSHPLSSPSPPAFSLSQHPVFANELALCITWPKYWSFSISPSNAYSVLIPFRIDWFDQIYLTFILKGPCQLFRAHASLVWIEKLVLPP